MFDPKADADVLKNAMKGAGSDKEAIINLNSGAHNLKKKKVQSTNMRNTGWPMREKIKSPRKIKSPQT